MSGGLTNTLITQREIAEGKPFSGQAHDHRSLFTCVHERVSVCEATVQFIFLFFFCDSSLTQGLRRAMGGIVLPRYLAQSPVCVSKRVWHLPPNICSRCRTPTGRLDTVKRCIEQLDGSRFHWLFFTELVLSHLCV